MAAALRPDLPLAVISELQPCEGAWIPYEPERGIIQTLRVARLALAGRSVELALLMIDAAAAEWKLRLLGLLLGARTILAVNQNLDYLELYPQPDRMLLLFVRARTRKRAWPLRRGWLLELRKGGLRLAADPIPVAKSDRPVGVSVVIPSRNGREMLARSLPLVVEQISRGEVIVVDNGSEDGTAEFVRTHFTAVRLLHSVEPLAFAAAVNRGVRAARFSHICPLNNDMAVAPGFFRELERAFDRFPGLFCAAPQVFLPPGLARQETGKMVIRTAPSPSDFALRADTPVPGEDLTYAIYGSSGCSLFDADRLLALGSFDEIYRPAYVEDCDLGFRAWQQGWPTVFVAGAHVVHEHRATMSKLFSKEKLDAMVAEHWLLFLARTVRNPRVFRRYWKHAMARASADGIIDGRMPERTAVLDDDEIIALCNGSVTVFPGKQPVNGQLNCTNGLPLPDSIPSGAVVLALVLETGPVPDELLAVCAEVVTVRRDPASFRAALRQTIRKWGRLTVHLDASMPLRIAS
jgi:O-antigen biosynthesis protein